MIILIDNYDSFSYNLYQLLGSFRQDLQVIRNDEYTIEAIRALQPERIVLSPGPGKPAAAGVCIPLIKELAATVPILGVCLGHQAICEAFGATVTYAQEIMHGKTSIATLDTDSKLFRGMNSQIQVARYHSLAALPSSIPAILKITASTAGGEIMAVEHSRLPIYGVQFHPESILTPDGARIIENFLAV